MNRIAKAYTDEEIKLLSAYLGKINQQANNWSRHDKADSKRIWTNRWNRSLGLMASCTTGAAPGKSTRKVAVVGGGFGGATTAKYLRMMDPSIEVTLIEPNSTYYTCPFSNLVVGGVKGMPAIAHDYKTLQSKYEVNFRELGAYQVKSNAVVLEDGTKVPFDLAVVSRVDIRYDKCQVIVKISKKMTHSCKA